MQIWMTLILALQLLSALAMIGLVLIQHGKGADMGASFGSGASGSLFGATGSANFLSRSTAALAAVFFACTLALAYLGNSAGMRGSVERRQRARPRRARGQRAGQPRRDPGRRAGCAGAVRCRRCQCRRAAGLRRAAVPEPAARCSRRARGECAVISG